jgi:hypothetical protein
MRLHVIPLGAEGNVRQIVEAFDRASSFASA